MREIRVKKIRIGQIQLLFRLNPMWQTIFGVDFFVIYRIEQGKVFFIDVIDIRMALFEFTLRVLLRKMSNENK